MAETALAAGPIYDAAPVLEVEGQPVPDLEREVLAMELEEREGGLVGLELRFLGVASREGAGIDLAFEHDQGLLALGTRIRVLAGDAADPTELFRGRISAVELAVEEDGMPELIVQAEDGLWPLRLRRVSRLHPEGRVRDVVQAVVAASGLRVRIEGLERRVAARAQANESDLSFLRRLLADHDAELQMVGEELQVAPKDGLRRGEVTLALGFQLHRVRAVADLSEQASRVTFAGFDAGSGRRIAVASGRPGLGPGSGRTGAEVLEATFGPRAEHLDHRHMPDEGEAQALVDAAFARRARRFVQVGGTAAGNPRIRVGTHLRLQGLGPRFSNTYRVTAACHRFDRTEGYLTEFEAEGARFGG